jgi:hypothetical protein
MPTKPTTPDPIRVAINVTRRPEDQAAFDQLCADTVITLVESGLYSWFQHRKYDWTTGTCDLRGEDPTGESPKDAEDQSWLPWRAFGPADIKAALERLGAGPVNGLHGGTRAQYAAALLVPGNADFDQNDADSIAQVAVFEEVVYG